MERNSYVSYVNPIFRFKNPRSKGRKLLRKRYVSYVDSAVHDGD